MKNEHQYFLNMCLKVKKFYTKNEEVLDNVKGMTQMMNKLVYLSDILSIEFENSVSYKNGYSIESARKREDLQKECIKFSETFKKVQESTVYKPNAKLQRFLHLDFIELNVLDEEELIQYASGLYEFCANMESRLKTQGVHQKAVEKFSKAITLFALDYPSNQMNINRRRQSNLLTLKALEDLKDFFRDKLDATMNGFSISNPELHRHYLDARTITPVNFTRKPDYEGDLSGEGVLSVAQMSYDRDREFTVNVSGGNAIWGLSKSSKKIDYSRPVNEQDNLSIRSRVIGPEGKHLMIQAVNPGNTIHYKIWIKEA